MSQTARVAFGLALGFTIGLGCRLAAIPVPAPPVLSGALLVLSMTCGYLIADRWLTQREARLKNLSGGPVGRSEAGDQK